MSIYTRDHVYDGLKIESIAADITKGTVALIQDVYCFYPYAVDVSVDDTAIALQKCKQAVADKKTGTGEDITAGDRVYGDPADSYKVSKTKGVGYLYLGIAIEGATASATTVLIEFDGTLHDVL